MLHLPSALFYSSMSIFMVFFNKCIISIWDFNNPNLLILLEMLLNILIVHLINFHQTRRSSVSKSPFASNLTLNLGFRFDSYSKYQYLTVVFYCFHSVLSLMALSGLNIPMYVMFKRCVPLMNLLISIFIFKNVDVNDWHTKKIIASISIMTLGVVIAGIGDIDFNLSAYLYCAASVVCQAGYLSSIQKHGESTTSSLQSLYDCSILSAPILSVVFLISNEPTDAYIKLNAFGPNDFYTFVFLLIVNIVCGSLLCFSQFWCTMENNAITTSVLGVLKSMLQTVLGIMLFQSWGGISRLTYLGISINFTFGAYYTYLKHREHGKS